MTITPSVVAADGAHLGAASAVASALPGGYTDTAGDEALLVIFARPGTVDASAYAGWSYQRVENDTGAWPLMGVMLRRTTDGSGILPADVTLTGSPTGVLVFRAVVRGWNPLARLDSGYPSGGSSSSDSTTLGGGYSTANPPGLGVAFNAAANSADTDSSPMVNIPGGTTTVDVFLPGAVPADLFGQMTHEVRPTAGSVGRSALIDSPSSAVRFALVYRHTPDMIPAVIDGVTAAVQASGQPGAVGGRASVTGATAAVAAAAAAGTAGGRASVVGTTAAVEASAQAGAGQGRASVAGATGSATASAQGGQAGAGATIAGATGSATASAQGGGAAGGATVDGATAAVVAAAPAGSVAVITVTITITGAGVAPSPWRGRVPLPIWETAVRVPTVRSRAAEPTWEGSAHAGH